MKKIPARSAVISHRRFIGKPAPPPEPEDELREQVNRLADVVEKMQGQLEAYEKGRESDKGIADAVHQQLRAEIAAAGETWKQAQEAVGNKVQLIVFDLTKEVRAVQLQMAKLAPVVDAIQAATCQMPELTQSVGSLTAGFAELLRRIPEPEPLALALPLRGGNSGAGMGDE